jgi:arginyl-tRNA synthetase
MKNLILIEKIQSVIKKIIVKNLEFVYETNTDKTKINAMVEKIKNPKMGDFTAKFLFNLKIPKTSIDKYAVYFKKNLSRNKKIFKKIEFVEPGFLNMTLQPSFVNKYIVKAFRQKNNYGKFPHTKQFYNLEFVSANPTGHLHLGHARNAAYGDSLSNI